VEDNQRLRDISYARQCLANGRARRIREQLKLTRNSIARELLVGVGTVYAWETGRRVPTDRYAADYGALLRRLDAQITQPPN